MQPFYADLMTMHRQVREILSAHRDTCPADKTTIPPQCLFCRELWYAMSDIIQAAQHLRMSASEESKP